MPSLPKPALPYPDVSIEPLSDHDLPQVMALSAQTLGDGYLAGQRPYASALAQLTAKRDGRVLGFSLGYLAEKRRYKDVLKQQVSCTPPLLSSADGRGSLGVIQTVGVARDCQRQGLGTRLVSETTNALLGLEASAIIVIAWKARGVVALDAVLARNRYAPLLSLPRFWHQESLRMGYQCPVCGHPCRCDAVLYLRTAG